ncbi:MAG TPA: site-2 protease family protein [Solirubrobacteraceae bacterium]|nr:site-2 protease family protein [Solirubrobacteraceae bacterium]
MNTSFRIGRLAGIEIGANWSWLLVLALVVWTLAGAVFPATNPGLASGAYVAMAVVAAVLFFASIVLHELGHARQARREGMQVGGITLWALGGVARFTGMFPSPGAELRVALAGPAVSLLLGLGFAALAVMLRPGSAIDGVVAWLGYINLLLFAFNLVPALPMDGGRVLRALLWRARGDLAQATSLAAGVGFVLGAAMVVVGLASGLGGAQAGGLWLAFIGAFVMLAGRAEADTVAIRTALAGHRVREAMIATATHGPPPADMPQVSPDADLAASVAAVAQAGASLAAVVDDGEVVGLLDVARVMRRVRARRGGGLRPSALASGR